MADPTQVLVAGAGPVGLTAAHEFARRGLRVRLIDAAPRPATTSRAVATHPRTLETYDQMGVIEEILENAQQIRAFTMFSRGRRLVRLDADYTTMPTRFPFTAIVEQVDTEAVLRSAVARLGVDVEWETRLTGFSQDAEGVDVTLEHADGTTESTRVPWLVGCDGGHSTVRKLLGLPLLGESSETWMLADAPVDVDLPRDSIYWVHTGSQALMMVPFRRGGRWRLLDTTTAEPGTDAAVIADRFTRKLGPGLGRSARVRTPTWTSVFTFQQRMVPRMGEGRVFVAGDAAHVHSPASGQGMNTGVQEAYNLAWKLALVAEGHAERELLDSYSLERVPIGERLLGSTKKATFLVQLKNAFAPIALPVVFGLIRNVPPLRRKVQRQVLGGISGLQLDYPDSPLTRPAAADAGPRPGTRASVGSGADPADPGCRAWAEELRDTRWTLAVTPDAVAGAPAANTWLSVRTLGDGSQGPGPLADPNGRLRAALGLASGGWLLVRPDGYVAARGRALGGADLRQALAAAGLRDEQHVLPHS
ncbi:FAD-dependent monooxygenase [Streptomyces phaeoluteigriseus]|uniref:FAD-dependent monooxygenase n=1 Tax=Streptomyces phaeoluteigriseus TaxID=114686 RepID=A0ABY4ZCG5_9ACTN|nr:FAD-dependent oxidoreductase [Streptomyces phaeoluteigriseus]USQ86676.1 FAD-dependent monooxygenase [Streptomyces phaeoluteigriseus]